MRIEFSQIALEEALENVVLRAIDEAVADLDSEYSTCTAVLESEESAYVPSRRVEHAPAD